jgi:hypothetical protein
LAHGGKRPGAGRPKAATSRKTREIAEKAAEEGITPLEVILEIMRKAHEAGDIEVALDAAGRAAPYVHPRLAAVQVSGKDGGPIEHHVVRADLPTAEEWERRHVESD